MGRLETKIAIANLLNWLSRPGQIRRQDRACDLGANSYLVKPPDAEGLMDMLQRIQSYWLVLNHSPECSETPD
jgi:hypothetical protein